MLYLEKTLSPTSYTERSGAPTPRNFSASLAPRKVWLAGTVDAAGKRSDPAAVRSAYGSAPNVEVLPEASWDVAALGRL